MPPRGALSADEKYTNAVKLSADDSLRARIVANLAAHERSTEPDRSLRPAAVAMTIVADEAGDASFVITRRVSSLRNHSGQWALPGGHIDVGEDPISAALRELDEEVGLACPANTVLGLLDDYPTRSGFRITPVVVWAGADVVLTPNPTKSPRCTECPSRASMRPASRSCSTSKKATARFYRYESSAKTSSPQPQPSSSSSEKSRSTAATRESPTTTNPTSPGAKKGSGPFLKGLTLLKRGLTPF